MSVGLIFCFLALPALWLLDRWWLRRAARKIDALFKNGYREPFWTPLANPDEFGPEVRARLDAWDELCRRQFGLVPLGRLRESLADGEALGVRSVLVNADRTITATFACSHRNPAVAFRSFMSTAGNAVLVATDARPLSQRPPQYVIECFAKGASEQAMFNRLTELRGAAAGESRSVDGMTDYIETARSMWRDTDAVRRTQNYVIDAETLRRLAPAHLGASRLNHLHRLITDLNRS